jgi:phosphoribosylaminoimidazole-succinocarboxamide synthase
MINPSALAPYAHHTLPDAVIPELPGCYRGKVRENYDLANGTRIIIATDRTAPSTATSRSSRSRARC